MRAYTILASKINNVVSGKPLDEWEWWASDRNIRLSNANISGNLSIQFSRSEIPSKIFLHFEDCTFHGQLKIDNFKYIEQITFNRCQFLSAVTLSNISGRLSLGGQNEFQDTATFIFMDATDRLSVYAINDAIFEKELILSGNVKSLTITNSKHRRTEDDSSSSLLDIRVNNLQAGNVTINQSEFENLAFSGMSTIVNFGINACVFKGTRIENLRLSDMFTIHDTTVEDFSIYSKDRIEGSFYFVNLTVANSFRFRLDGATRTIISKSNFKFLSLWGKNSSESALNIESSMIANFAFEKVTNSGQISLREIDSDGGKFKIESSNLGKTDFIFCDFSKTVLEFENSKLTEAFLSESDFPKKVIRGDKISYKQAQLIFGQLTTAYQKQGDTVRALEYQSREIQSHFRDLVLSKKVTQTRFNLFLNWISNDFGRSWLRGGLFTIGIALIFYYAVVISTNEYGIGLGFSYDERLVSSFFNFLNPLRFFDAESLFRDANEQFLTLNAGSHALDLFGRIMIAYGIYQTIQAFRRYGRK
ncbi:MAG TPA: hypothetical protein VHN59_17365 [Chitinophagaceae bacterium]|nr:hypothetical protein [Chitinophagaceae bacterium]